MQKQLEDFYNSQKEPNRSCLFALRDIILNFDPNLKETTKYGMPCFVLRKKHFCYLWIDKITGTPYILLVDGVHIEHTALKAGARKRMKVLEINPEQDIPLHTIHEIFNLAIHYRNKPK
ncbi:MAG: DUF1801 domain-containing protein [Balneolales bacterium]|nr:DUF1801 domain-containing protein [Balneolales bacterium]